MWNKFQSVIRRVISPVLRPIVKSYLQKERSTRFGTFHLIIPPGIFHPGLFFSTRSFWKFLRRQPLADLKILEIGTGSGALAISCAGAGAKVVAVDIFSDAVAAARANAKRNSVEVEILESDLFDRISETRFDRIIVNPPFYPRDARSGPEHAWNCGAEFRFFTRFFRSAPHWLTDNGRVWMVLSDGCDIEKINLIALQNGWNGEKIEERRLWLERSFIYCFITN